MFVHAQSVVVHIAAGYLKNLAMFPDIAVVRMRVIHNQNGPYMSGFEVTARARLNGSGDSPANIRLITSDVVMSHRPW